MPDFPNHSSKESQLSDRTDELSVFILDGVSRVFRDHFTNDPTAVCIKLLISQEDLQVLNIEKHQVHEPPDRVVEEDEPLVYTFTRDPNSKLHGFTRPSTSKLVYHVKDCSAFEELSRTDRPPEETFLFCPRENLQKLYEEKRYKNPTPEFWKDYKSTMVLPIRRPSHVGDNLTERPHVVGFLALDCPRPKRFNPPPLRASNLLDMPPIVNVAAGVADALYWPLELYLRYKRGKKDQAE